MKQQRKFKFTFNVALFAIFVIIFAAIACINSSFLTVDYVFGVMLRNIVEIGIVALPMTLIIITGGIDLSVGNIMVLSAMLGGLAAEAVNPLVGVLVTLATGVLCGLLNGVIITKAKISPMVATLATMFLFLGLARGMSKGDSVYSYSIAGFLGNTYLGDVFPLQLIFYAILAAGFFILLDKTTYGRKLYSIGMNENTTRYSGINTDRVLIKAYIMSGLLCAFAAMIWLGRFTSIKYDAGTNFNLKVITVVVLGGTSILGGIGDMKGTIIATLIIATLNSGLTVLNIPIDTQTIVQGVVLIISLIAYAVISERAKTKKIITPDVKLAQTAGISS